MQGPLDDRESGLTAQGKPAVRQPGGKARQRRLDFLERRRLLKPVDSAIQDVVEPDPVIANVAQGQTLAFQTLAAAAGKGTAWNNLGPSTETNGQTYGVNRINVSGRVSSIAVDKNNVKHLLCGSANGGVWQSLDGGATWTPQTDNTCATTAVGAVVFDPNDSTIAYCGTGEGDSWNMLGQGVLRSTDGGTTWAAWSNPADQGAKDFIRQGFYGLVVDPAKSTHLLAATTVGAYVSNDSGVTWTQTRNQQTWSISVAPAGGPNAEILAASVDGLSQSVDGGNTWTPVAPLPGAGPFVRLGVAIAPSNPTVAYAWGAIEVDDQSGNKVWVPHLWQRSSLGVWTELPRPSGVSANQAQYDWYVAVSPSSELEIYVGAIDLHRGIFDGTNWTWQDISTQKPRMTVEMLTPAGHTPVSVSPGAVLEPDAPIVQATFPGAQQSYFASILDTNDVAVFDSSGLAWTSTGSSAKVSPRRLRALAFVLFAAADQQIFFIGNDLVVYGLRNNGGVWGSPAALGAAQVYSSAMLAAASRAATSVDVFTFNSAGLLTTCSWTPAAPSWPAVNWQAVETTATSAFLPMSAIAAVSADANTLHVFAIGTDLRLRYVEYTGGAWSAVKVLGAATDLAFTHTRIAAHVPAAGRIEVVVMDHLARARLHTLNNVAGSWTEALPPVVFESPLDKAAAGYAPAAANGLTDDAYGWRLNPYSDLCIAVVGGSTTFFAAALKPGMTAVLRHSTAAGSAWQRYV
jgi:hypothetical protein